jgi:hypothetical protein
MTRDQRRVPSGAIWVKRMSLSWAPGSLGNGTSPSLKKAAWMRIFVCCANVAT